MVTQKARRPLIPGLSRKQIAERLGVSWRTVERWEQKQKWPRWVDRAFKYHTHLNLTDLTNEELKLAIRLMNKLQGEGNE